SRKSRRRKEPRTRPSQRPPAKPGAWNDEWLKARPPLVNRHTPRRRHSASAVRRFVSPHPNPLHRGEGTASLTQRKTHNLGLFSEQRTGHPLPRERDGVRGNGAKYVARVGPIPELSNSSSPPAE